MKVDIRGPCLNIEMNTDLYSAICNVSRPSALKQHLDDSDVIIFCIFRITMATDHGFLIRLSSGAYNHDLHALQHTETAQAVLPDYKLPPN